MTKLTTSQNKTIEEFWINIDEYRKKLKFREWELTENKRADENIGGGKANRISDTTADKAMILASDENYQHLRKVVRAIDHTYENADDDSKTIVEMRYWSKYEVYEWEDIADKLFCSRSKVLRKRNVLIDKTAQQLGWL